MYHCGVDFNGGMVVRRWGWVVYEDSLAVFTQFFYELQPDLKNKLYKLKKNMLFKKNKSINIYFSI